MNRLRCLLLSFSFLWIFLWSIFGTLIASRITTFAQTQVPLPKEEQWLIQLLTSAHSHMNVMSLLIGILGISLPLLFPYFSLKILTRLSYGLVFSIILFGAGLLMEAFHFPFLQNSFFILVPASLGAVGFILSVGIFGVLFFVAS